MLMGDGARLMSTRSRLSGDGQTRNDLPPTRGVLQIPTEATGEFVNEISNSKHAQLHVDNSESEHEKNDITSKAAGAEPPSTKNLDHANKEEMRKSHQSDRGHTSDESSAVPESVSPSISASTGVQPQPRFSAETVQASIRGAVAAVASQASAQENESPDTEARKMSVGENVVGNKKRRCKRKPQVKAGQSTGRWTVNEHRAFLEGLRECGREWKKVALRIPTRTSAQIRSHAQKYFSKLQRDHESIVNHGDSSNAASVPAGTGEVRPSAVRSVDRILSNPHEAEREVENTLEALRERYRQLQLRLEQRQRLRANGNGGELIEDDTTSASTNTRKRALEEPESNDHSMDDQSSVSSAVSASVASISSGRGLGNEELIALHVLGGDLARGDASADGFSQTAPAGRKSPESSDNSSESDSQGDGSPTKRQRKEA